MAITTGILLFDEAEELDFVGPLEVLSYAQHDPNDSGIGALDPSLLLSPLQSAH